MTFSIAARCEETGMFGIAVSSSSPAVAARCAFARADVGAAASQNMTDPSLGTRCLDLMESGHSAESAIRTIVESAEHVSYRQLSAVDNMGRTATYSGEQTLGVHAAKTAQNAACAGNLLSGTHVPDAMVHAFSGSVGHLGDRLLAAMKAAVSAGGEAGPVYSAGMLLVDKMSWPIADLRIDWHEAGEPVDELEKLWGIYSPQLNDYVSRAINPSSAPRYGELGDV